MAEVFLARRRAGGVEKLLVIKRIRAERAGDVRFQELFKREAKLSMSLAHQNIVPVFDFGRIGDRFFLAMERVEGKDLGSSLAQGSKEPPPVLVAAFIAAECCQALAYAHQRKNADGTSRNIVHRDVTPRNVLLSWSGEVKLTDFGIASLAGDDANKLVGTPAYMAPEQARSEPVDVRTDVYALGMVLREALTGERARPGDSHEALLAAARAGTLSPWPTVDPVLTAIVDRATAATASERYAEIHEMLADLDAYIVAERAKHRGDSPAKQLAAWLTRVWEAGADAHEGTAEQPGEQPEVMSFLDDDADAVGTGTQRSLAATAADEPEPAPTPPPVELVESRSRVRAIVVVAMIATSIVVAVIVTRAPKPSPGPVVAVTPDATPDAAITVEPDAAVVAVEPDAAVIVDPPIVVARDAGRRMVVVRGGSASGSGSQGSGSAPAIMLRKVHINATPWAYFTVDGGPRMQTPKLLELASGPHRIHFENDVLKVEREITIDVPADRDISHVEALR